MPYKRFSACLYCGSRTGDDPEFVAQARIFGQSLGRRGHRLVYGAGDRGLMGEAARAMQASGGRIMGIIPQHLVDWEVGKSDIDDYVVTQTMHERKTMMFENADAIVALPGGPGTLDELIEVLTWRQLGLHEKPVVLVNVNDYWTPLLALLEHLIARGFAEAGFRDYLSVVEDASAAVALLEERLS